MVLCAIIKGTSRDLEVLQSHMNDSYYVLTQHPDMDDTGLTNMVFMPKKSE